MTLVAQPPAERADQDVTVALPDDATAPGQARQVLRELLPSWGLTYLLEDAELAASELVTNALHHGLPPVSLSLQRRSTSLRIEVSDMRPSTARHELIVASGEEDESGRGQGIVASVSDHTGLADVEGAGKSVYATWDVASLET